MVSQRTDQFLGNAICRQYPADHDARRPRVELLLEETWQTPPCLLFGINAILIREGSVYFVSRRLAVQWVCVNLLLVYLRGRVRRDVRLSTGIAYK